MEPLKPVDKKQILESNPAAEPGDIEEYERLLSQRFTVDPDLPTEPGLVSVDSRETRLRELHQKLFGRRPLLRSQ